MIYESAASAATPPTHPCHLLLSAPVSGPAVCVCVGGGGGGQNIVSKPEKPVSCFQNDAKLLHSLAVFPQQKSFDF